MAEVLISFLAWTFAPSIVTRFTQSIYYEFRYGRRRPKPQPGSSRWISHNRRIHLALLLTYFIYSVYSAFSGVYGQGDFYRLLGIDHESEDRAIKSRFRRLAALHHPDKVATTNDGEDSEVHFLRIRLAQETLLKPVQRFAYDRFGPDMLEWEHCSSVRDYLVAGLTAIGPSYVASAAVMILLGLTGYLEAGRFWRYLISSSVIVLDTYTLTRPFSLPILKKALNPTLTLIFRQQPLLPFQMLIVTRKIMLSVFVVASQLSPYLSSRDTSKGPGSVTQMKFLSLEQTARSHESELTKLLELEIAPFAGRTDVIDDLRRRIKDWLVQNTMRADAMVKASVSASLQKRSETDAGSLDRRPQTNEL